VVEVNWRATRVITLDEAFVVIPNGQLGLASIRNFSKPDPWSRRSLFVTTPYAVSPQLENPGRERISPLLDDSRAGTKAKSAPVPDFPAVRSERMPSRS